MQDKLIKLSRYADNHLMAINRTKTKAMLCNTRTKWDFEPELTLDGKNNLEIVEEIKIVGYMLRNDMKTCSNTAYQGCTIKHGVLTVSSNIGRFEGYRHGTVTSRPVTWSDLTSR